MNNKTKSISLLGCGWLGLPLAHTLVESGYEVWGSTTTAAKFSTLEAAGVHPVLLQLSPELSLPAVDPFFKNDVLIISLPPRRKTGSIVNYLLQLKEIAERIGEVRFKGILLFSTTGVYSRDAMGSLREEDADTLNELWQAEEIIRSSSPRQTTVIRFGGLIGPSRHPGRFLAGKKGLLNGDEPVNLIHQKDAVGITRAIIEKNIWGETFNAVAANHPSRKEFYTRAAASLGLELPEFLPDRPSPDRVINADKVRTKLSYSFEFDDPFAMIDYCV